MQQAQIAALNRWFDKQENVMKQEIERQMNQKFSNFKTAQLAYFKHFEENTWKMSDRIGAIGTTHYIKAKNLRIQAVPDLNDLYVLNTRLREISAGNLSNSKVGYNKIQNVYMKDVTSMSTLSNMRKISINSYGAKENSAAVNSSWDMGMDKLFNERGKLSTEYANIRIRHYDRLTFGNKILLMSLYLYNSSYVSKGPEIGPPISINGVTIPVNWTDESLLAMGKKMAPAISGGAKLLEPGYLDGLKKNCGIGSSKSARVSSVVKPGDGPGNDPYCDRVGGLETQRDQFIQKEIDKLHPKPPFEIQNMAQYVQQTWASRKNCPGCWIKTSGTFENRPSLKYSERRDFKYEGIVHQQYMLVNGDIISRSQTSVGSEYRGDVIWYMRKDGSWFEFRLPPAPYKDTDLNFLFEKFWDGAKLVGRYAIPIEDVIILIDGKDFDGVDRNKALAGAGILFTVVPGSKLVKPIVSVTKGSYQGVKVIIREGTKTVVKNFDDLLEVSKLISKLNLNIRFILEGTGPY